VPRQRHASPLVIAPTEIDPHAKRSISQQIADIVHQRVRDGKLRTGDPMPSQRQLTEQLGHARETISGAYQILESDGLIVSRGSGPSLIRAQPPARYMDSGRYAEELRRAKTNRIDPEQTQFCVTYGVSWNEYTVDADYTYKPATERHAQLLVVPQETEVLRRELVEYARGVPVQIRRSLLLAEDVRGTPLEEPDRQPWPGGTVAELWSIGYSIIKVPEELVSRPPTPWEAETLMLPADHEVYEITRRFLVADQDKGDRPAEVSELVMPTKGNRVRWITYV
jgi:GntR family transcriptional regulator